MQQLTYEDGRCVGGGPVYATSNHQGVAFEASFSLITSELKIACNVIIMDKNIGQTFTRAVYLDDHIFWHALSFWPIHINYNTKQTLQLWLSFNHRIYIWQYPSSHSVS